MGKQSHTVSPTLLDLFSIHSVRKHLLSTYYVPDPAPFGGTRMNQMCIISFYVSKLFAEGALMA